MYIFKQKAPKNAYVRCFEKKSLVQIYITSERKYPGGYFQRNFSYSKLPWNLFLRLYNKDTVMGLK